MSATSTRDKKGALIKTLLYLAVVVFIVGSLYWLSLQDDGSPPIPADKDHAGITDWTQCLRCHSPDGPNPTKPSHPINNEKCFRCHQPNQPTGNGK